MLGPLSERMGVRGRGRGQLLVSDEEMEAASMFSHLHLIVRVLTRRLSLGFYHAFCFYKV